MSAPLWSYDQLDVEQIPMFIDASDIIDNVERGEWESVDYQLGETYDDKLEEAYKDGLYNSIAEHGVERPIVMRIMRDDYYGNTVWTGNGHHRTAVAAELGQMVPVIWAYNYDVWADDRWHSMASDGITRLVDLPA